MAACGWKQHLSGGGVIAILFFSNKQGRNNRRSNRGSDLGPSAGLGPRRCPMGEGTLKQKYISDKSRLEAPHVPQKTPFATEMQFNK